MANRKLGDKCPVCGVCRAEMLETGHRPLVSGDLCPEACTCIPPHLTMAEHFEDCGAEPPPCCPCCGDIKHQRYVGIQEADDFKVRVWNCDVKTCRCGSHSYRVDNEVKS
jgi:hypothetical protein